MQRHVGVFEVYMQVKTKVWVATLTWILLHLQNSGWLFRGRKQAHRLPSHLIS